MNNNLQNLIGKRVKVYGVIIGQDWGYCEGVVATVIHPTKDEMSQPFYIEPLGFTNSVEIVLDNGFRGHVHYKQCELIK